MAFRDAILYYDRGTPESLADALGKELRYRYQKRAFDLERALLSDRQLFRYRVWRNQLGVDAAADPRELRYVDPDAIRKETAFHPDFSWRRIGAVRGGDWDLDRTPLQERFDEIYAAVQARYVEGRDWESIPFVYRVLEGERSWHDYEGEAVWGYCEHLDRVFESMCEEGFLPMREVLGMSFEEACASEEVSVLDWMDDLRVDVGRDGRLLRHDGKHRLWFARILDIDRIPVCVTVRHREWQRLRDEIAAADAVEELSRRARRHLDHPDMIDVRGDLDRDRTPERTAQ